MPLKCGSKFQLCEKLMKEIKLGCYAGPFEEIPFQNYMQSPIGLVPKQENDVRLLFHLSHDFKDYFSVNHYRPVKYSIHIFA